MELDHCLSQTLSPFKTEPEDVIIDLDAVPVIVIDILVHAKITRVKVIIPIVMTMRKKSKRETSGLGALAEVETEDTDVN